ncbi:MAG: hypothetical protein IKR30_02770 [Bacteroidales bacterium]|nr:hypothetical protein [Bacteroidales bacterium]
MVKFSNAAIADLETIVCASKGLRDALGNWRALESLPLEHWRSHPKEEPSKELLEVRKEQDVRKFREPAECFIRDLNRGLVSFGLEPIHLVDFIDKGQG